VGLKGGQLALLLVQAVPEGGPDALKLGVGQTGQGEQLIGQVTSGAQGGQDALNVGDGGKDLARLDLGDLALRDATPSREAFASEANGLTGISQSSRQLVTASTEFFWLEYGNGFSPASSQ